MADQEASLNPVRISARDIPPPPTISPAAQQVLSQGTIAPRLSFPMRDDADGWRKAAAATEATWGEQAGPILAGLDVEIRTGEIAGVLCYDCVPNGLRPDAPVYLYAHGGAFVVGGGIFAKLLGARAAASLGTRVVSVDYRMPPDHPFPAAPQDCLAVYKELLETVDPKRIVVGGASAGGNIAASTVLMIRDQGLPLPAGAILLTPEVDLTESGDSFRTNADLDVVLKGGLPEANAVYAGSADLRDPYVSPLFADFSKGYPPTLVQTGTRDLFLSNSVMIHRKLRDAGIDAELHVWEAMPHGGFLPGEAPENQEISAEVARFIRRVTT